MEKSDFFFYIYFSIKYFNEKLMSSFSRDAKRSAKVKEIMGSLSMQEGEYQKIKRMKN